MSRGQRRMQHKVRRLNGLVVVFGAAFSSSCCFQYALMNSTGVRSGGVTRVPREPKRIGVRNKSRSMLLALTQANVR